MFVEALCIYRFLKVTLQKVLINYKVGKCHFAAKIPLKHYLNQVTVKIKAGSTWKDVQKRPQWHFHAEDNLTVIFKGDQRKWRNFLGQNRTG